MILDNQVGETERDCFDGTENFRDLTKTQKMANIPKTLFSASGCLCVYKISLNSQNILHF